MIRNKKGFSVVEVLVAGAMLGIVGLAMISMMETTMKSNKNNLEISSANEWIQIAGTLLSDIPTCQRNFGPSPGQNLTLSGAVITTDIVDAAGTTVYDVNSTTAYQNNMWLINNYSLTQESIVTTAPVYIVISKVDFTLTKKTPQSSVGSSSIRRTLRMWTQLTGAGGTIISCRALGATGNEFWRTNNGTDIFNVNSGNVGLGTLVPASLLSVGGSGPAGGAFRVGAEGDVTITGGVDSRWSLYDSGAVEKMTLEPSGDLIFNGGKVGIGTNTPSNALTISGETSIINGSLGFNRNPSDGSVPTGGNVLNSRFQLTAMSNYLGIESYSTSGVLTGSLNILGSNGYVGIGVNNPSNLFSVGNGTVGGAFRVNSDGDVVVSGGVDNRWGLYGPSGGEYMGLNNSGDTLFLNGRVGVGSTAPSHLLSVGTAGNAQPGGTFKVGDDGDLVVTGGVDNRWGLYQNANEIFAILPGGDIEISGRVGIFNGAPSVALQVSGSIIASGSITPSDIRLKKNIEPLNENVLEKILNLNPVSYEWKKQKDRGMNGQQVGFIAQEVQKKFPNTVLTENDKMGTLSLKLNELIAFLVKALQEFYSIWQNDSQKLHLLIGNAELDMVNLKKENSIMKNWICSKDPQFELCSKN